MTDRDIGSGPDGTDGTTNFGFRRNRLAFMGGWSDKVSLYVQTEFTDPNVAPVDFSGAGFDSNFQLLDAAVRFTFSDAFKLNVGKFKYNLSRENLEACEDPLTLDRSLFIRTAYVGTRDDGVALWGNLFGDRFQYRVDAMEGRQAVSGTVAPSSNPRYSARGHVTLLDPENGYGYKGTYLGKKKVLTVGAAYQIEPEVTYTDPATKLGNEDYQAWTVDGFFEYPLGGGTVTLSGAYEKVDLDDAYKGATPDAGAIGLNGEKNGWYGKAGYLLPRHPAAGLRPLREVALRLPQQRVRPDRRLVRRRRQLLRLGPEPEAHRRVEQDGLRPGGHLHQPSVDPHQGLQPVRHPDPVHLLSLHRPGGAGLALPLPRLFPDWRSSHDQRFLSALAVVVLGATLALAAPMKGKVTSIDGKKVQIELVGEKAAWVKKGAPVKWKGGVGRVTEIKDAVLTMNSKNAAKLKVGDEVELEKGPADPRAASASRTGSSTLTGVVCDE